MAIEPIKKKEFKSSNKKAQIEIVDTVIVKK